MPVGSVRPIGLNTRLGLGALASWCCVKRIVGLVSGASVGGEGVEADLPNSGFEPVWRTPFVLLLLVWRTGGGGIVLAWAGPLEVRTGDDA